MAPLHKTRLTPIRPSPPAPTSREPQAGVPPRNRLLRSAGRQTRPVLLPTGRPVITTEAHPPLPSARSGEGHLESRPVTAPPDRTVGPINAVQRLARGKD